MGRSRNFNDNDVLDSLILLFSAQGYEAASFSDIVVATGLNRASLYASFGDKKTLFLAAIDRYCTVMVSEFRAIADEGRDARGALQTVFDRAIERVSQTGSAGCLLTNTAAEFGTRDADILERVQIALAGIENTLDAILRQGDVDQPRHAARFLLSTLQGINILSKVHPDRRVLARMARQGIDGILA